MGEFFWLSRVDRALQSVHWFKEEILKQLSVWQTVSKCLLKSLSLP